MFISRTMMAVLFTIAIASSFLVVSGFVGSVFAAKMADNTVTNTMVQPRTTENIDPLNSQSAYIADSIGDTPNTDATFAKDLKKLLKCESSDAADGDLTLAEVKGCYSQVF
jgi:hypothetical protein